MSKQSLLEEAWRGGKDGTLSALEQARAWALREAWTEFKSHTDYGMLSFICSKVMKVNGGRPSVSAISQLFERVDADAEWFPGKITREVYGPAPIFNGTKRSTVARSAMAMKARGEEPTYASVLAANPLALKNPQTGELASKSTVYDILKTMCYDDSDSPHDTWTHLTRHSATALRADIIDHRLRWQQWMTELNHQPAWYFKHLVWTDFCSSILPRSEKRHQEMKLARKGKKGWGSQATKKDSKNLKGNTSSLKQKSHDSIKIWWAPILARGKLHVEVFGEGFPGEKEEGAAVLVSKLRSAINIRFPGDDQPDIVFVDRGPGFWNVMGGNITKGFKRALQENGLRTLYGDDGWRQPGKLADVLLHETAVSWIRSREQKCRVSCPWTENVADFTARLKGVAFSAAGSA